MIIARDVTLCDQMNIFVRCEFAMNVYFNQSGVVGVGDVDNGGATTPHNTV